MSSWERQRTASQISVDTSTTGSTVAPPDSAYLPVFKKSQDPWVCSRSTSESTIVQHEQTAVVGMLEPPKDGGKGAIQVLAAAILFDSAIIGLPLAYGVFQDHYTLEYPGNTISPWIGVLSNGVPFLGAPLMVFCTQNFALDIRWYFTTGFMLCIVALLGAAFCTALSGLVLTQGLLYGIGVLLCDIPVLTVINTWFDHRKGLAYGLMFGGADLMAVPFGFLISHLLSKYSLRVTMLILLGVVVGLSGPAVLLIKERIKDSSHSQRNEQSPSIDIPSEEPITITSDTTIQDDPSHVKQKHYYVRPIFYIIALSNLLQALTYYLPFIYLPTFATALGHHANTSTLILSLANLAQVPGEVLFGRLSDKIPVTYLMILSTTLASLSTFILWGVFAAKSMAALVIFALCFGCFGSGFMGLWARMGSLFGDDDAQQVFSVMCFGRGIGSIVSGPISEALISKSRAITPNAFGAGRYAYVVGFVGGGMAISTAVTCCGAIVLWRERKAVKKQEGRGEDVNSLSCIALDVIDRSIDI